MRELLRRFARLIVSCIPPLSVGGLQLLFLKLREPSLTGGSLVACGAGGWVQFWNTSGGGLVGEFNVWDTRRHTLHHTKRSLHSVTAMHVNETETVLYTGNSLGYLQVQRSHIALYMTCIGTCPSTVMGYTRLLSTQELFRDHTHCCYDSASP